MEKEKKIGLFEKWNQSAGKIELSFTRVLQGVVVLYWMFFNWHYFNLLIEAEQEITITFNFILLNVIFLIGIFYPKYLKDFIDLKEKLKVG